MNRIAVFGVVLWLSVMPGLALGASFPKQESLSIQTSDKSYMFTVEIAETPEQQEQGLMRRKSMERNHGMLFIQSKDRTIHMWMKDTFLPLDMLFIDKHGEIVYIAENAKPYSTTNIGPERSVRAVLELLGGTVKRRHIRIGDHIIHHYFQP